MFGRNFLRFRARRDSGMRVLTLAATAVVALLGAVPASADPGAAGAIAPSYPPPFVDHVFWTQWSQRKQLPSLRVYPTASGRAAARELGSAGAGGAEGWSEGVGL